MSMSSLALRPLLVGLDAGGSRCRVRVVRADDLAIVEEHDLTSTGWAGLTDRGRADALERIVGAIAAEGRIEALVAGVHGSDSPEQQALLSAPLARRLPRVIVVNDSELLVPAHGLPAGTGVTAGTGSSATATSPGGTITVGGWGWILGDEGGAVGLVRDAAALVLDAHDADESDPLSHALMAALNVAHPHGLGHCLATTDPRIWAEAAPVIFAAAQAGSRRARALIERHAKALTALVALLQRRGGDTGAIVCAGGVMTGQPALFEAFRRAMGERFGDGVEVSLLAVPPVAGAVRLAEALYRSEIQASQGRRA